MLKLSCITTVALLGALNTDAQVQLIAVTCPNATQCSDFASLSMELGFGPTISDSGHITFWGAKTASCADTDPTPPPSVNCDSESDAIRGVWQWSETGGLAARYQTGDFAQVFVPGSGTQGTHIQCYQGSTFGYIVASGQTDDFRFLTQACFSAAGVLTSGPVVYLGGVSFQSLPAPGAVCFGDDTAISSDSSFVLGGRHFLLASTSTDGSVHAPVYADTISSPCRMGIGISILDCFSPNNPRESVVTSFEAQWNHTAIESNSVGFGDSQSRTYFVATLEAEATQYSALVATGEGQDTLPEACSPNPPETRRVLLRGGEEAPGTDKLFAQTEAFPLGVSCSSSGFLSTIGRLANATSGTETGIWMYVPGSGWKLAVRAGDVTPEGDGVFKSLESPTPEACPPITDAGECVFAIRVDLNGGGDISTIYRASWQPNTQSIVLRRVVGDGRPGACPSDVLTGPFGYISTNPHGDVLASVYLNGVSTIGFFNRFGEGYEFNKIVSLNDVIDISNDTFTVTDFKLAYGSGGNDGRHKALNRDRTVAFAAYQSFPPRYSLFRWVAPTLTHSKCDLNCDGNIDSGDESYLIGVVAGGPIMEGCPFDADLNCDGSIDQGDVDWFVNARAGGGGCD